MTLPESGVSVSGVSTATSEMAPRVRPGDAGREVGREVGVECCSGTKTLAISMLGALWFDVIIKWTGVDRASKYFPLIMMGRGCFSRARTSAWSMAAENVLWRHSWRTSMRALVNEYRPGSGAMASQLEAEIVSVMLLPLGKVALAAPAQQSSNIKTSDMDLSRSVWIADHLELLVRRYTIGSTIKHTVTRENRGFAFYANVNTVSALGKEQSNIRAPPALPRLIYPCMPSIVDDKQGILRLVLLDQLS
jgi:hypothetical protein